MAELGGRVGGRTTFDGSHVKVMFPFAGPFVGGAQMSTSEMVRRLVRDVPDVEPMVVLPEHGPVSDVFRRAGTEPRVHDADMAVSTRLRAPTDSFVGRLRAVPTYLAMHRNAVRLLRRHRPDVLHLNEDRLVLPWGLAARRTGVRVVWHVRQEQGNAFVDPIRARLANRIVFVADANRARFAKRVRLPPTVTLYNVVDPDRFAPAPDRRAAKQRLGLDGDVPVVTFVGNLFERKRPHWFLEAVRDLQSDGVPLVALLIGARSTASSYPDRLERLAAGAADPTSIRLLGRRDDVHRWLAASDVATLPSRVRGEAFPRAVIEAMAAGACVVATDVAGVGEAVEHDATGLLVDPDDYVAYREALRSALTDRSLRERLGREASVVARRRFGGEGMARRLRALYLDLIGDRAEEPAA